MRSLGPPRISRFTTRSRDRPIRRLPGRVAWGGSTNARIREISETLERPKFYVAGLPEMVSEVVAILGGPLKVPEDDFDYEMFRGY